MAGTPPFGTSILTPFALMVPFVSQCHMIELATGLLFDMEIIFLGELARFEEY